MDGCRDLPLTVYLLDQVDFAALVKLQRRLVYETSGARDAATLLLCEHPPGISVGRQGSRSHIHLEPHELGLKGWSIRWVNRGGGCLFHAPGQLAIYPILPLDRLALNLGGYLNQLQQFLLDVT